MEDIAQTLQHADSSPHEYISELIEHIESVEPTVGALVAESNRESRLWFEAKALSDRFLKWERPPLYGVPVGIKDVFHVDGFPTRAGSNLPPEELAGPQAEVVSTLKEAGALLLGKTVTTEFAYADPGPTKNPHDLKHTPGGSSTGSAAAVAAGMCPLGLGTQTTGSTIRPAAFCGIVGFKPSFGRIPTEGIIEFSESVDHVGLFTQDVTGVRRAANVVCREWKPAEPDEPILGIPEGPYLNQASGEGLREFERHVEQLDDSGYEVRRVEVLDDIKSINERHRDLITAEASLAHHDRYESYGDRYRKHMTELIEEGRDIRTERLAEARTGRHELRDRLAERMYEHDIDVWVSPAALGTAPEGLDDTGDPVMNLPWTHAGMPTVSLPAGEIDDLPLGLQCSTRFGVDESLLSWSEHLATALQSAI